MASSATRASRSSTTGGDPIPAAERASFAQFARSVCSRRSTRRDRRRRSSRYAARAPSPPATDALAFARMSPWLLALFAGLIVAFVQYGWRELRAGWRRTARGACCASVR